jgi:hypothetical protein
VVEQGKGMIIVVLMAGNYRSGSWSKSKAGIFSQCGIPRGMIESELFLSCLLHKNHGKDKNMLY